MHAEKQQLEQLILIVERYTSYIRISFGELLRPLVASFVPPQVKAYLDELAALEKLLRRHYDRPEHEGPFDTGKHHDPMLRNALIWERLRVARSVEERRAETIHRDVLEQLDAELKPFDPFLEADWFRTAHPKQVPQLTEFFPVARVEARLEKMHGPAKDREYDEKFGILQAPTLFLDDLDRARKSAELRGILVAAAFIDIDKFKDFNTEKGEPFIDRNVLPTFMRHVEAHVYKRGHAYRYGGDEYAVLLPNVTEQEALESIDRLRNGLGALTYEGTERKTTVSAGVVIVRPDCHFTGQEILSRAALAKDFAKRKGRDRVASFRGPFLREDELEITDMATV